MNSLVHFEELLGRLLQPTALAELGVLAGCLFLAWGLLKALQPADAVREDGILFGQRVFDGALFPALALALALLARNVMRGMDVPLTLFKLVVPVLVSLAIIRLAVRVLHRTFPSSRLVRALERTISWGIWLSMVLWVTGLLPLMLDELAAVSWRIGGAPVTLRDLLEGALTAAAVMVGMLWLSAAIEARLMAAQTVHVSVRKIAINATRAGLLLVGLLMALSAAGIPLGALSVMGGALGVGIGLGLQKLAANYVSGFVILAERAMRIGDLVAVGDFEGRITDITTRYTVIRAASGREAIVPNENLITQRVDNLTYADSLLGLSTKVQVGYDTDLEALFPKILATVGQVPRVVAAPGPGVRLSLFADNGLELTVGFSITDPHNGQANVVGDVNLALWRLLNAEGVDIPYPQRVVRQLPGEGAAAHEDAAKTLPPAVD